MVDGKIGQTRKPNRLGLFGFAVGLAHDGGIAQTKDKVIPVLPEFAIAMFVSCGTSITISPCMYLPTGILLTRLIDCIQYRKKDDYAH